MALIIRIRQDEPTPEEWAVEQAIECFLDAISIREYGCLLGPAPSEAPTGVIYIDDLPLMKQ